MVKEIIWSPLAIESFESIVNYLLINFGESVVKSFVTIVDAKLTLIKERPKMFCPTHQKPFTYITRINRRTTLIYRYNPSKNKIELVVFWGMQNPANRPQ